MFIRLIFSAFLLQGLTGYAQYPEEVTEADLKLFEQKIESKLPSLKQNLSKRNFANDGEKALIYEYEIATFKINERMQMIREKDYSTQGMINMAYEVETEYDKMLNKYYKILMNKLSDVDKESLKRAQQNWIKFRDSERNLNDVLSKDDYTGGGTMHSIICADYRLEITKKRVAELFDYLIRIDQ